MFNKTFTRLAILFALAASFSMTTSYAQCNAEGGIISFLDGSNVKSIIVDGTPDPLDVSLDGMQMGTNGGWVITDLNLEILALPPAPPFDLDPAGTGDCLIWYIRYEDGLMGAAVGNNAADLMGCYDLSNALTVERRLATDVNGGNITFTGGSTYESICVDGTPDPLDVELDGTSNGDSRAWVITDTQGNILALPPAPPFDLDPAGPGTCLIWYLRYNGQLTGAMVGNNAADLSGDFDLSNPLTVQRNEVDGGGITLDNGSTMTTIIVDGVPDPLNLNRDGSATGSNSAWVITDTQGNILALPPAPPFDLDPAGVGTCLIWYLRYEDGLTGAAVGNNAADLMGCYDLSNPITVERVMNSGQVETGDISMPSGATTRYTCPGNDPLITVQLNYSVTTGQVAYAITDHNFDIIGIQSTNTINASGAPPGTCYIFAFNYTGNLTGMIGDRVYDTKFSDDSWKISNNGIRVVREAPEGGTIATKSGETTAYVCLDSSSDFIGFEPSGEGRSAFTYVITDESNNILAFNDDGFQDFNGAPPGNCRVWGLSYTGAITAQAGDNAATVDLTNRCWDLSDNYINVVRQEVKGGRITSNGSERASVSASNPVLSYSTTSTSGADYAYFILDRSQRIAAITFDQSFDFSTLGDRRYYIYGMSHNGTVLRSVGDSFWGRDITDACFERSDNAIVVSYDAAARPFAFTANPIGYGQLSLKLARQQEEISTERITLRITDAYGRVVFNEEGIDAANLENRVLELSNATPGIHFISIQQNDMLVTERVVMP